jgi:hypothetical protein
MIGRVDKNLYIYFAFYLYYLLFLFVRAVVVCCVGVIVLCPHGDRW